MSKRTPIMKYFTQAQLDAIAVNPARKPDISSEVNIIVTRCRNKLQHAKTDADFQNIIKSYGKIGELVGDEVRAKNAKKKALTPAMKAARRKAKIRKSTIDALISMIRHTNLYKSEYPHTQDGLKAMVPDIVFNSNTTAYTKDFMIGFISELNDIEINRIVDTLNKYKIDDEHTDELMQSVLDAVNKKYPDILRFSEMVKIYENYYCTKFYLAGFGYLVDFEGNVRTLSKMILGEIKDSLSDPKRRDHFMPALSIQDVVLNLGDSVISTWLSDISTLTGNKILTLSSNNDTYKIDINNDIIGYNRHQTNTFINWMLENMINIIGCSIRVFTNEISHEICVNGKTIKIPIKHIYNCAIYSNNIYWANDEECIENNLTHHKTREILEPEKGVVYCGFYKK